MNKKTNRRKCQNLIAVLNLIILLFLSGCTLEKTLQGEERQQWIDTATPIAHDMLESLNNNTYDRFISHASDEMKERMSYQDFSSLREKMEYYLGTCMTITPTDVRSREMYVTVFFAVKCEKSENVRLRIVFKAGDETHKVYDFLLVFIDEIL